MRETCSCGRCRAYIVSAPRLDEVVPRQDVPLSANTLASSVGAAIDRLDAVVEHIEERALSWDFTALDATSMKVLDTTHPLGIRTGSLWLIEGDHQHASAAATIPPRSP